MPSSFIVDALPGLEGHSAALMGDYLVVYGGKTSASTLNPHVLCLNLTTMRWQRLVTGGDTPAPRCLHTAVAYGWKMIVFGGLLAIGVNDIHYNVFNVFAHPDSLDNAVLRRSGQDRLLDPNSLPRVTQQKQESYSLFALSMNEEPSWAPISTYGLRPPTRAGHSATVYRSTMYVYGGYSVHASGRPTDDEYKASYMIYSLNLETLTWTAVEAINSISPLRWGMSAVLASSTWIFFGGVDITQCAETNTMAIYHFEQGEWRWPTLPPESTPPPCRSMHCAVRWGDTMLVFGGSGNTSSMLFNDLYALDLLTGQWIEVATTGTPPLPRSGHSATIVGNCLFIFGGVDHSFYRAPRLWSLDLQTWEWSALSCDFSPWALANIRGIDMNDGRQVGSPQHTGHREVYSAIVGQTPPDHHEHHSQSVQTFDQSLPTPRAEMPGGYPSVASGHSTSTVIAQRLAQQQRDGSIAMERMSSPLANVQSAGRRDGRSPPNEEGTLSHTYPVAWSPQQETLQSLRHGIAQSKNVLNNMLEAAEHRAEHEKVDVAFSPETRPDKEEEVLHQQTASYRSPLREGRLEGHADEAAANLAEELSARHSRLKDLSHALDGSGGQGTYTAAQQYWKTEIQTLSKQHDLFRQATQRANALETVYDRLATDGSGAGRMQLNDTGTAGPTPRAQHSAMTQESSSVLFPHSTPMLASIANSVSSDPNHPAAFQRVTLTGPKKEHFVSPSIQKLGLTNQLGKNRNVKSSLGPASSNANASAGSAPQRVTSPGSRVHFR